jgi:chromosome undetermined scaffold_131, whole genome shotgun sequence
MEPNIVFIIDEDEESFLHDFLELYCEYHTTSWSDEFEAHYKWNQKEYIMIGTVQDGKKDGKAVMSFMGVPRFELNYRNGELTGPVRELDNQGVTKMSGHLVNGIESGLFEEYNRYGDVIWCGYYRNGKRYSQVVKNEQMEGYYDEICEENGILLSSSQYDEMFRDKNGSCLEYENGVLRRSCIYCNGKKIREDTVCREPMIGMTDFYKEFDSTGHVCRICEYDDDFELSGACYDIQNGKVKQMSYYQNNTLFRVFQSYDGDEMTEYGNSGEEEYIGQFAGDLLRGFYRHGEGKEYAHKEIQYSGSFVHGKREGIGTEFQGGRPIYQGYWRNGRRNGKEGLGNEEEETIWLDGHIEEDYYRSILSLNLPPYSQFLSVSDGQFNEMNSLCLYGFNFLKTIAIGSECFQNVLRFDLIGLDCLEKVTIDRNSFRSDKTNEPEGECCILDCPHLSVISVGDFCFQYYTSLHLVNLPSLQTLELGQNCFFHTSAFVLSSAIVNK